MARLSLKLVNLVSLGFERNSKNILRGQLGLWEVIRAILKCSLTFFR